MHNHYWVKCEKHEIDYPSTSSCPYCNTTPGGSGKITTDSPYYKWASELMVVARTPQSCVTMRIAELLEDNLPDWLESLDWCDSCEERADCDNCDREPRYNEGYL